MGSQRQTQALSASSIVGKAGGVLCVQQVTLPFLHCYPQYGSHLQIAQMKNQAAPQLQHMEMLANGYFPIAEIYNAVLCKRHSVYNQPLHRGKDLYLQNRSAGRQLNQGDGLYKYLKLAIRGMGPKIVAHFRPISTTGFGFHLRLYTRSLLFDTSINFNICA